MDAHAKGERAWSHGRGRKKKKKGRNDRKDGVMKMDRERETEANGRTRRREGRLRPTSHLSCVTGSGSYNAYIHIGDGSSIVRWGGDAGVTVTQG